MIFLFFFEYGSEYIIAILCVFGARMSKKDAPLFCIVFQQ